MARHGVDFGSRLIAPVSEDILRLDLAEPLVSMVQIGHATSGILVILVKYFDLILHLRIVKARQSVLLLGLQGDHARIVLRVIVVPFFGLRWRSTARHAAFFADVLFVILERLVSQIERHIRGESP